MATRKRRPTCKRCGRHESEVGEISARGLCADDSRLALEGNIRGLHFHTGPAWDRWRLGMARSVDAMLRADDPAMLRSVVDNAGESG